MKERSGIIVRTLIETIVESRRLRSFAAAAAIAGMAFLNLHCASDPEKPKIAAKPYVDQGYRPNIPRFMHGSVYERTEMGNVDPYPVSGYSLVVNLADTGDNSNLPTSVRAEMIKQMAFAGFGSYNDPRFTNIQPEDILRDKRVAVVQVVGMLPVGIRRGQNFDLIVRAMPRSHTTSLAHGHLYNTELRIRGMEQPGSGGMVLAYANAGDVFVNPAYALEGTSKTYPHATPTQVIASLNTGTVMNGGKATEDRPIFLQLRVPQASIARAIESRVVNRFPSPDSSARPAASAQDEGLIELYVPYSMNGDWRHFTGVVNHLFLNDSPDFDSQKTRQLMAEAHKPNAPLSDISFCLEGMGPTVVPIYQPLITDPDPAVAYAAARAAVYSGDAGALEALTQIAIDSNSPFQLAAVYTLGSLPHSPAVDRRLEPLLGSDKALVRIEAYKILADHGDLRIMSDDIEGRFKLDIVDYPGPPLVYAARTGEPKLAIFGRNAALAMPVVFAALQDNLTISSDDLGKSVTIYYRGDPSGKPVRVESRPLLAEIVSRLGGRGAVDEDRFSFCYADVVAVVQAFSEGHLLTAQDNSGLLAETPFVLEQSEDLTNALVTAELDSRPQSGAAGSVRPAGAPVGAAVGGTPVSTDPSQSSAGNVIGMGGQVPSFGDAQPPAGPTGVGSSGVPNTTGSGNSGAAGSPSVPSFGNP